MGDATSGSSGGGSALVWRFRARAKKRPSRFVSANDESAAAARVESVTPMIFRFDQITVDLPPERPRRQCRRRRPGTPGRKIRRDVHVDELHLPVVQLPWEEKLPPLLRPDLEHRRRGYSHIEAVTATINLLLKGTHPPHRPQRGRDDPRQDREPAAKHKDAKKNPAPLKEASNFRNTDHFLNSGQQALPQDSMGRFWTGQNVFSSGN